MAARPLSLAILVFAILGAAAGGEAQWSVAEPEATANVTFYRAHSATVEPVEERFVVTPGGSRVLGAVLVNDLDVEQAIVLDAVVYWTHADGKTLVPDPDRAQVSVSPTTVILAPRERVLIQILLSVAEEARVGETLWLGLLTAPERTEFNMMQGLASGEVVAPATAAAAAPVAPLVVAAAGGATVAAAGLVGAALALRRDPWALGVPVIALYSRLRRAEILDQATRERVHRLVAERPGIRWAELRRLAGIGTGALLHHLTMLERHGFLTSRKEGPQRRFFQAGARLPEPEPFPITPGQARVIAALADGGLTQSALADRLGITQQGASYHLKALERRGFVTVEREGDAWTWRVTDAGATTAPAEWSGPARDTARGEGA